jgi:hypothetical protein
MWRKTILVALLLALMALETSATELRYEFSNESCDASVTYDPARHDPEAVKNTADILYGFFDYHGLSCHARAELLRSTRFVDLASVKALTASIADGSETYCGLLAVEERGAKDTHALREYPIFMTG